MITRVGRKAISISPVSSDLRRAMAAMSSAVTEMPSSFRRRFSIRIREDTGSVGRPGKAFAAACMSMTCLPANAAIVL